MNVANTSEWDGAAWDAVLAAARDSTAAPVRAGLLWSIYGPLLEPASGRPFVVGQIGQSLDGRVATVNGHSRYINGPSALTHLHRLRALVDAVVVGVGTAVADDPELTVRHAGGPHPARVVVDPHGRLPADAKCLRDDGVRCIVIHGTATPAPARSERIQLAADQDGISPVAILEALYARGFRRILIEGGPRTLSRFVAANLIDRLHVMVAPMIIGSGPAGLELPPIAHLDGSLRPEVRVFRLDGGDILYDCALRP